MTREERASVELEGEMVAREGFRSQERSTVYTRDLINNQLLQGSSKDD